jgi:hypothetical protein
VRPLTATLIETIGEKYLTYFKGRAKLLFSAHDQTLRDYDKVLLGHVSLTSRKHLQSAARIRAEYSS